MLIEEFFIKCFSVAFLVWETGRNSLLFLHSGKFTLLRVTLSLKAYLAVNW